MSKNYLREIRKAKGLSQEQLAELMGTTHVTVQRHERSKRKLDWDKLKAYADALGCLPSDIMEGPGYAVTPRNEIQRKILQALNEMSEKEQEIYGLGFLSGLHTLKSDDDPVPKSSDHQQNAKSKK